MGRSSLRGKEKLKGRRVEGKEVEGKGDWKEKGKGEFERGT